ncbi:MAG: FG-GAP-like repeat-containing protein [Desulfobacterales bacterium]
MKTSFNTFRTRLFFLVIVTIVLLISGNPGFADNQPKKVVVVPFKINAPEKMEYLKTGITDMLTSRISWENRVSVVGKEETLKALADIKTPLNETTARELGRKLKASYVLFGSLTVFGNSVSIDAKVIDVTGTRSPLTFFNQSKGMDEVVPQINLFAEDINSQLFQRVSAARKSPPPSQPKQPDIYKHPEKLLQEGGGDIDEGERSLFARESGRLRAQKAWKSRNFKYLINGLAVGDVNSDGKAETVIITPHSVRIFGYEKGRLFEIETLAVSRQKICIGVDVADINANGVAEIFITSQTMQRDGLASFVLEYDGKSYTRIVKESSWYYRVSETPQRGKILLGQRNVLEDPYAGGIFELNWESSDYVPQKEINTPPQTNLMGYMAGDVMNDGEESAVAYSANDRIRVINSMGKEEWKGSDHFGGSMLYVAGEITERYQIENRRYLPMRILVYKNPASGKSEIIVAKNYELTGGKLALRKFVNSHIESLSWHGLGVESNWRTRKMSGQIRDLYIADFNHDGKKELIAALILKEGSIAFTEKKSTLIAYELE